MTMQNIEQPKISDEHIQGESGKLRIEALKYDFTVCKVADYTQVDWASEFCFAGKTDEERSLVCVTEKTPANALECDDGWKAFRIQGVLDLSLIGILSKISTLLAEKGIGIFAVSTYNTDYILTKKEVFGKAMMVLACAGYAVEGYSEQGAHTQVEIDPNGTWYHGSNLELEILREGSTITQWRALAEAFSHKPKVLGYEEYGDDGSIVHNGTEPGYLYVIDEPVTIGRDVYQHPHSSMDPGSEWLTRRELKLRLIATLPLD